MFGSYWLVLFVLLIFCFGQVFSVAFLFIYFFVLGRFFLSVFCFYVCFFYLLSLFHCSQASALLLEEALSQLERNESKMEQMAEQLRLADRCKPPRPFANSRNLTSLKSSLPLVVLPTWLSRKGEDAQGPLHLSTKCGHY